MENPAKRSRDEFDEANGGRFAEYDDPSKKLHVDPETELVSNICKDIRRIGENSKLAEQVDDISYISNPIVAEFEKIEKLRAAILSTLYAVVREQPHKIPNLCVLIFICNAKNFLVAKYVVEFFHAKGQELLDTLKTEDCPMADADPAAAKESEGTGVQYPDWSENAGVFNDLKSILKFLATLSPIIESNAMANILKQFLQAAIDLQNASPSRNGTAEEIFYNTLLATPYLLCSEFSEASIESANEIIDLAHSFKIVEDDTSKTISVLEPFDSKDGNFAHLLPYRPRKLITLILPALVGLQTPQKNWVALKDSFFLNFSEFLDPVLSDALKNNSISSELVKHLLPQFSIPTIEQLQKYKPEGLIDALWVQHPRLIFQVYNSTSFETVPSIESYYGLFFKDVAFDILTNMSFNQKEASIQLSILDLFCSKNLFSPPGSSVDQLSLVAKDNELGENNPPLSTWKVEDVAVESILTMIFQLPKPLHYEIYYYTVLISCCRESPESIAPVFGRAIRFFYNNLDTFDYELKIRFMDWMTTQISNFDFSWKWDEWVQDSVKYSNLLYHPKKNFIRNLIAKEIRLSNKNRIKDSFVTMTQTDNGDGKLVALDEFYQYLDISLYPNADQFVIDYDTSLYGDDANDEFKNIIKAAVNQKKELASSHSIMAAQEELIYEFSNPQLPLNEVANKLYDFIIANWRTNEQFHDMVNETLEAIKSSVVNVDNNRILINLIFQTYAYIGSRSIYSVVSIINRDVAKLKFISGEPVSEEDYKLSGTDFAFPDLALSEEEKDNRQSWIVESILRIWIHQPQVGFLILEYLIEFKILHAQFLIRSALKLDYNLIINNVSCMESINRVLSSSSKSGNFKDILLLLFDLIVRNLNEILESLHLDNPDTDAVKIQTDFTDDEKNDKAVMSQIDNQWLFFEYRGLLKTYLRQFSSQHSEFTDDVKEILGRIVNSKVRDDAVTWTTELKY